MEAMPGMRTPRRTHHRMLPHDVSLQAPVLLLVRSNLEDVHMYPVGREQASSRGAGPGPEAAEGTSRRERECGPRAGNQLRPGRSAGGCQAEGESRLSSSMAVCIWGRSLRGMRGLSALVFVCEYIQIRHVDCSLISNGSIVAIVIPGLVPGAERTAGSGEASRSYSTAGAARG